MPTRLSDRGHSGEDTRGGRGKADRCQHRAAAGAVSLQFKAGVRIISLMFLIALTSCTTWAPPDPSPWRWWKEGVIVEQQRRARPTPRRGASGDRQGGGAEIIIPACSMQARRRPGCSARRYFSLCGCDRHAVQQTARRKTCEFCSILVDPRNRALYCHISYAALMEGE
jgi:hypothetical protein